MCPLCQPVRDCGSGGTGVRGPGTGSQGDGRCGGLGTFIDRDRVSAVMFSRCGSRSITVVNQVRLQGHLSTVNPLPSHLPSQSSEEPQHASTFVILN